MSEANNDHDEPPGGGLSWEPVALLDASDDLFAVADANYRYLWANEAYCRSRGKTLAELEGRRLSEVIDAQEFKEAVHSDSDEGDLT